MDIAVCIDNNYVMPAGVLFCSICENNKDQKITIHVITDHSLTDKSRQSLQTIVQKYGNCIVFYPVDEEAFKSLPMQISSKSQHFTIATYYRLFLTDILPESVDRVLYLDSDIIVRHSLKDLWNTDISQYAVGCVTDMCEGIIEYYNRLWYPSALGYFNGGVLLINLRYWREHNLMNRFIQYVTVNHSRLRWNDQDVLNAVLKECKKQLPMKYDVQEGYLYKDKRLDYPKYKEELDTAVRDPYILHFTANIKPWYKDCVHPYKAEFFKYRALTEWKDMPLQKRHQKKTKIVLLKSVLRVLHILPQLPDKFEQGLSPL